MRSLAAWTLILPSLTTAGGAASLPTAGYSLRVWQTDDGLPQNLVTSAVQTRDGYLWFGTNNGLTRFNGERFQVFDSSNSPELQDRRITRLFEDAQGTLWIGHEAGAITRYSEGRFETFSLPTGAEAERIIGLGTDESGKLWAMRENGSVGNLGDGTQLASLIAPEHPGIMAWTRSERGAIWVGENGRVARLSGRSLAPLTFADPVRDNYAFGIAASAEGGVWVLCDGRIRRWKDGNWVEDRGEYPWSTPSPSCCLELRDGTLAVGTIRFGLFLVFRDGRPPVHFDRSNGLPQDWVRFLFEDREGNIWAGTGSTGLVTIRDTPFSVLNSPDDWQGCSVLAVAPGLGGALWVGTDGAGLYHFDSGKWRHFGEGEGLSNTYISAVTENPEGETWAGNYWWGGPYVLNDGHFVHPDNMDMTSSAIVALVPVPGTRRLLVGNRDGLLEMTPRGTHWLVKSPEGTGDDVCAVVCERSGAIWCGFSQGGLARLTGGETKFFRRKDGLGSDSVQCLLADDDGALWIGTADNGLSRFKDGHFSTVGVEQGLADNTVCYILDDNLGNFWLSTHEGIQRVSKSELNQCADGTTPAFPSQIYDRGDGLPIIEFLGGRQAAGCRTDDGRLWFASSKGVVSVDPTRIQANPIPPPVVIESLLVDGTAKLVTDGSVVDRLPPDHQRLEFRFSGLSFVAPDKVRFRYRLEGLDRDWVDAGTRRLAFYSHLPAGRYRFRVIACNNDGLWNTEGASVAFVVAPFFWETPWFLVSVGLMALTSVGWLVRYFTRRRMQMRMEQLEHQNAVDRERARIARDIHDDIGTTMTRITMLSQPTSRELEQPRQAAAVLSRIYSSSREITRSLDEIVWAIDPRHDTLDSLVGYMGKFAQDLFDGANVRCRLDLPAEVPAWQLTADMRHNLFLAFKEALNNILKHAAASEVRISLNLRSDVFVLVVKDDGCGFDTSQPGANAPGRPAGGHGLPNLQRRLARIGGRCEISSDTNGGTSVTFTVPVPDQSGSPTGP